MKVGVNLLNFGPGVSPESLSRWTEIAETLGYHLVMISDHVAVTPDVEGRYPAPLYDPFTTLSWLAAKTRRVALGTTVVIIPYRSPLLVARMGANLDQLSGGRFILGVGVGWAQQEFDALGVPFRSRGAMTDEYLEAIKVLWTNEIASYEGRFVSFADVRTAPLPVQSPHPPIWVGGSSDAALRRAVRLGDGWHPIRIRVDWLRDEGLRRLREIAEREERPVPALCPRIRLKITRDFATPPWTTPNGRPVTGRSIRFGPISTHWSGWEPSTFFSTPTTSAFDDPEATKDHEDAASRYLLVCNGLPQPRGPQVQRVLERAFREYGLPQTIRSDNGPPFASVGLGSLSQLAIWWIKLGIIPERIEPGHPEQNGRLERLHRTLKAETASPPQANGRRQQRAFDTFRHSYNEERPHEALGQSRPRDRYSPSFRSYPSRVSAPDYEVGVTVRKVRTNGEIKWRGNKIYLSEALRGEPVGLSPKDDRYWIIRYGPLAIGLLDDHTQSVQRTPINVLPMSPV